MVLEYQSNLLIHYTMLAPNSIMTSNKQRPKHIKLDTIQRAKLKEVHEHSKSL